MMIKCQKCGFENQMGSIFCRSCGEKLDMDAIDPNKLQKDVSKEKNIKLAKKRIKSLISALISLLFIAAFFFVILYRGRAENPDYVVNTDGAAAAEAPAEGEGEGEAKKAEEDPAVANATEDEKKALSKYNKACNGEGSGKVTYSYREINLMFKKKVVEPLAAKDTNAKITSLELAFDAVKNQSVIYIWFKVGNKVPMLYTIHCWLTYQAPNPDEKQEGEQKQFDVSVKRLDIGLLPLWVSTKPFLNAFAPLLEDDDVKAFFSHAKSVDFTGDGVTIEFMKPGEGEESADNSDSKNSRTASASSRPSAPDSKANIQGKSANEQSAQKVDNSSSDGKTTKKSNSSSESRKGTEQKTPDSSSGNKKKVSEKEEKRKAEEEERKRKAEEYRQQKKEQEEERKRKAAEEAERKKQEREEERQRQKEENERKAEERRREREDRRNNNYNNNSRSKNSRNRGSW